MTERDPLFLRDILRAVSAIERYTNGGREAFFTDDMIQLDVVWAIVENDLAPLKREIARIVG